MELSELHRRAVEGWLRRVEAVRAEQWRRATPCAEWDVRDLVGHVVGEELWTRPLMEGLTIAEVGDRFDGDVLGADPAKAALAAGEDAIAAVDERLPRGGTVQLSMGETPVEEYAFQLTADHLVHAWDLAAAIGEARDLDPLVVDAVATWFADREALYREAGAIAPRPDDGAGGRAAEDPQDELLLGFGRDPDW